MNTIDLSPLYCSSVGFDTLASMLNSNLATDNTTSGFPPYNIEVLDDNLYTITLAVAGFDETELDIQTERSMLTVSGDKTKDKSDTKFLYKGIPNQTFKLKFALSNYVEVTEASLQNGLLSIHLVKQIPEELKPKMISISTVGNKKLEGKKDKVA